MAHVQVHLLGIGLVGPGLPDWPGAQAVLRGEQPWATSPTVVPAPQRLPATERRRAGAIVKASMAVADAAVAQSGLDPALLATVFSASGGDGANCHALCEALAEPDRLVSPTRFTNSVHNAAAGYWHIATHGMAASSSLCACDASFAAGLLDAAVQACALGQPVLLVATDQPYPEPLQGKRPLPDVLGLAVVLSPTAAPGALATLSLRLDGECTPTACRSASLEPLRQALPVARALPLLEAWARGEAFDGVIEHLPGAALQVRSTPA